jgi:hypothetical protein
VDAQRGLVEVDGLPFSPEEKGSAIRYPGFVDIGRLLSSPGAAGQTYGVSLIAHESLKRDAPQH